MKTMPFASACLRLGVLLVVTLLFGVAGAFEVPQTSLDEKEFFKPDLVITSSNVPLTSQKQTLQNRVAWDRFLQVVVPRLPRPRIVHNLYPTCRG